MPVTTNRKEIDVNDHHLTMEEIKGGVDLIELTVNDTLFSGTDAARDLRVRQS